MVGRHDSSNGSMEPGREAIPARPPPLENNGQSIAVEKRKIESGASTAPRANGTPSRSCALSRQGSCKASAARSSLSPDSSIRASCESWTIGPTGLPVLFDFGLVARFAGQVSRDALEAGAVQGGSMAYMAPEQIRGEVVDARADLYALGCILFELLTGRRPFNASSLGAMASAHLNEKPQAPSLVVSGLPEGLEAIWTERAIFWRRVCGFWTRSELSSSWRGSFANRAI